VLGASSLEKRSPAVITIRKENLLGQKVGAVNREYRKWGAAENHRRTIIAQKWDRNQRRTSLDGEEEVALKKKAAERHYIAYLLFVDPRSRKSLIGTREGGEHSNS